MKIQTGFVILGMMLIFSQSGFAAMGSLNYSIPTSVISGGVAPIGSANFQTNSTLGQPSPITFISSTSYDLYPGFWYTMVKSGCVWDLEPDGDVDGLDLYQFVQPPYNASDIESFGTEFGRTDCSN